MCVICGCSTGTPGAVHQHGHDSDPAHAHPHDHGDLHYGQGPARVSVPGMSQARAIRLEADVLGANQAYMDAFYTDVRADLKQWRESRGLPADPTIAPTVTLWKSVAKPLAMAGMAAAALGGLFHYVMKGPNEVSKEIEAEVERELEGEK